MFDKTHAALASFYKGQASMYSCFLDPVPDQTVKSIRMREVFEMARKMCEAESCQPDQIEALVVTRIKEICGCAGESSKQGGTQVQVEPPALTSNESAIQIEASVEVSLRKELPITEAANISSQVVPFRLPNHARKFTAQQIKRALDPDGVARSGWRKERPASSPSNDDLKVALSRSSKEFGNDLTDKQLGRNHANIEADNRLPNSQEASMLDEVTNPDNDVRTEEKKDTFEKVESDLRDTLTAYQEEYAASQNATDYKEITKALAEAIQQARTPSHGQKPQDLWESVATKAIASAARERRRRGGEPGNKFPPKDSVQPGAQGSPQTNNTEESNARYAVRLMDSVESMSDPSSDIGFEALDDVDDGYESPSMEARNNKRKRQASGDMNGWSNYVQPAGKRARINKYLRSIGAIPRDASRPKANCEDVVKEAPNCNGPESAPASLLPGAITESPIQNVIAGIMPPHTPSQPASRIYTFSAPAMNGTAMRDTPEVMQAFYHNIVHETLDNILNNVDTGDVRYVIEAYRNHVEENVPR